MHVLASCGKFGLTKKQLEPSRKTCHENLISPEIGGVSSPSCSKVVVYSSVRARTQCSPPLLAPPLGCGCILSSVHSLCDNVLMPFSRHWRPIYIPASWKVPFAVTRHIKPPRMATSTNEAQASLLDDRIVILDRHVAQAFPANKVFRTVSGILALVRVSVRFSPLRTFKLSALTDDLIRTRWLPTMNPSNSVTTVSTYVRP